MRKEPIYKFEGDKNFKIVGYEILADFPHLLVSPKLDLITFKTHIDQINKEEKSDYIYHLNIKLETIRDYMEEVKRSILSSPKKEQIVLEILEDEIDEKTLDLIISSMAGEGIKISIDDFGTKSSNFDRVLKYKSLIESIKIDRVLWKNMQYVVKSIVEEMKDIKIIAEKVETEVELKSLLDMGIVLFQGWYFKDNFDKMIKKTIDLEFDNFEEEAMFMVLKQALKLLNRFHEKKDINNLLEYLKYSYLAYKLNIDIDSEEFRKLKKILPHSGNKCLDRDPLQNEIKLVNFIVGELSIFTEELQDFKKEIFSYIHNRDFDKLETTVSRFAKKVNGYISSLKDKELEIKAIVSNLNVSNGSLLPRENLKKAILNAYLKSKNGHAYALILYFPALKEIYSSLGYSLYEKALKKINEGLDRFLSPNKVVVNYDIETLITFVEVDPERIRSKLTDFFNKLEVLLHKKFANLTAKISYIPLEKNPEETIDDLTIRIEHAIYEFKNF